jgi:F1F0 ATPase subunit 2
MNNMQEILVLILSLVAGVFFGLLFFGGLWLTTKQLKTSKAPALFFLASFILRTTVVLVGFYLVSATDIKRLILCLIGFVIARFLKKIYLPKSVSQNLKSKDEVQNES